MRKPIKVFYSELSGRFYASASYRENKDGIVTITGAKYDVTNDIGAAITEHEITFKAVKPKSARKVRGIRIQRLPGDAVRTTSLLHDSKN